MEQAITVGDVLTIIGVIGGVVVILSVVIAILSAYAKGFTH